MPDDHALSTFSRRILPDDGVAELEAFPFAPGESPFRIKGVAYRGHVDYVNQFVPGGMGAVNALLPDPRMRTFFEETSFLASSQYDVVPLAYAGVACAKVTGTSYLGFVQDRTQQQVELDTAGVYRGLISLVSVHAVVKRMPQLVSQYTSFAKVHVEWSQGDVVITRHEAIPRPIAPWWIAVTDTYVRTVGRKAGATSIEVSYEKPVPVGSAHGVPLVTIGAMAILR